MAIKKLRIRNFKSFRDVEVELRDFNLLIGANASGKSNFIQVFQFLRDIVTDGLENAISLQGGIEFLRNAQIKSSEDLMLDVESDINVNIGMQIEIGKINLNIYKTLHEFSLSTLKNNSEKGYKVLIDNLTCFCKVQAIPQGVAFGEDLHDAEEIGKGRICIDTINPTPGLYNVRELDFPEDIKNIADILSTIAFHGLPIPINRPHMSFPNLGTGTGFESISIFDFDPKLIKSVFPITGKADLDENGKNLTLVLKSVLADPENKRRFSNIIKDTLPFIDDLKIKQLEDPSLMIQLKETYTKDYYFPSFLISDGTINVTALIIALFFEHQSSTVKPLTIFEEPDRGIHPHLISKVVHMLKDASSEKQIIASTHNPEMLKHADLEDVLLVSRDKEGFSIITKPAENEELKVFLENDLGIDDLYVQNLLEI